MTPDKRTRAQMRAHCENIGDDDGIDPHEFFKVSRTNDKSDRKARQLCRQVAETLDQVLSGEIDDDFVGSLHVASVVPAPDSSRLLVTLCSDLPTEKFDRSELDRRLGDHRGRLRCAVSAAITRRKTPILTFHVLGPNKANEPTIGEDLP